MKLFIAICVVITVFALYLGIYFASESQRADTKFGDSISPTPDYPDSNKLFSLINSWRKSQGLPEYIKDNRLCVIAEDRADDPILDEHIGLYRKYSSYPYVIQENLINLGTNKGMLDAWLSSPPHHATLLKPYRYSCVVCKDQCVEIFSNF